MDRDREDTRRLLVGAPGPTEAVPVTPPGLQVRGVLGVDGDTVLFQASAEPTEVGLWAYGPGRAEPDQRRAAASRRASARAGPRSSPAAGSTTTA